MAEVLPAGVAESAWSVLDAGRMHLRGAPVGLCASVEDEGDDGLNYRECFTRDFAVAAAALLARGAERLRRDDWPEYYDGPLGGLVGRHARLRQTWTAAGMLAAGELLDDPSAPDPFAFEPDEDLEGRILAGAADGPRRDPSRA